MLWQRLQEERSEHARGVVPPRFRFREEARNLFRPEQAVWYRMTGDNGEEERSHVCGVRCKLLAVSYWLQP